MESDTGTVHLESSHSSEQSKTHCYLSPLTINEPIIESLIFLFNRLISYSVILSYNRNE